VTQLQPTPQTTPQTEAPQDRSRRQPGGLFARFEHLAHELGKFGMVGITAFAVDLTVFNVLLFAGVQKLLAATISMVIAATVAFIGNRFWTWRDRERTNLRREYSLYFLFNLVGLVIGLSCLAFSSYVLGAVWPFFQTKLADNLAKNIVGMALGTAFRFWSYRQIVFRKRG
jgi:putative flippase GtrA